MKPDPFDRFIDGLFVQARLWFRWVLPVGWLVLAGQAWIDAGPSEWWHRADRYVIAFAAGGWLVWSLFHREQDRRR